MRKLLVFMLLLLAVPVLGAEAPEVVEEVAEKTSKLDGWMPMIGQLSSLLITILTPVLLILGVWLAKCLAGKLKVDLTAAQQTVVTGIVKKGVNWADAWAVKQDEKPSGEAKMQVAVKFILDQLKDSDLPAVAEGKLKEWVEGQLVRDKT